MTTDLYQDLGSRPIAGAQPAGAELRDEPAFERLEVELAKLASPVHSASLDWNQVNTLAVELLSTKGKDLLVACYLTGGLLETRGLAGLADGVEVVADMLQTYWDKLYPPLRRIRGRRNAMQWLIDRIQQRATETDWASLPPQEMELVTRLTAGLMSIDAVLAEKDDEAPSIRAITALVNNIQVIQEEVAPPPAPAPAPASAGSAAATPVAAAAPSAAPQSGAEAERALDDACVRLGNIGGWLLADDNSNALPYRLDRLAAWTALTVLPPADKGQTRLPAPISQITDALARLETSQSDADIIEFTEAQLAAFPFWLDLNCRCAAALARLGAKFDAARLEVCGETARLVARLPGLEKLAFAGGMPFADGETLDWLAGLGSGPSNAAPAGAGGEKQASVAAAVANARKLAANDDLEGAAAGLQQQLALQTSAKDQLVLQIRLCELLLEHRPGAALKAFAQGLVASIDRHDLAVWDPALALDGLAVAYGVMARKEDDRQTAEALLKRIVALDAGAAVRLVT